MQWDCSRLYWQKMQAKSRTSSWCDEIVLKSVQKMQLANEDWNENPKVKKNSPQQEQHNHVCFSPISIDKKILVTQYKNSSVPVPEYLCAWGNDAVSEVNPRRVNCWLKTISNPPLVLARAPENFWKVCHRLGPHIEASTRKNSGFVCAKEL